MEKVYFHKIQMFFYFLFCTQLFVILKKCIFKKKVNLFFILLIFTAHKMETFSNAFQCKVDQCKVKQCLLDNKPCFC